MNKQLQRVLKQVDEARKAMRNPTDTNGMYVAIHHLASAVVLLLVEAGEMHPAPQAKKKSISEIRELVADARRIGGPLEITFDTLCEAVDAMAQYIECGGEQRPPHGQDTSTGYLEDGRGGFVREAPMPRPR